MLLLRFDTYKVAHVLRVKYYVPKYADIHTQKPAEVAVGRSLSLYKSLFLKTIPTW